jgi:hypothetical protein
MFSNKKNASFVKVEKLKAEKKSRLYLGERSQDNLIPQKIFQILHHSMFMTFTKICKVMYSLVWSSENSRFQTNAVLMI